ncbi:fumarate reductase subunit C [uncultured Thiodictyon sp.]|uniref:fumarate reductase subunit C n=1 Tax=uncultured Thiodictyon sp. TaxID=1846217 RepID=UPI0025E2EC73|nr:fumarate reductase subunit C [uncultured Thiodictyon sp.]
MSRFKPVLKTYRRPMSGWWTRNPYFVRYMIREGSAVFLTAYALVLLAGLACLVWGQTAYDAWRGVLATPLSIGFHLLALLIVTYHSITWFQVMPKTAPRLPSDPRLIVWGGFAAAAGLSALIFATLLWVIR